MDTNEKPELETPVTKTAPPVMDIRAPRPAVADIDHQVTEHGTPDPVAETLPVSEPSTNESAPQEASKTKKPWVLIIITLVVIVAIAVGAWFVMVQPEDTDNTLPATSTMSTNQSAETTTPVNGTDVSEVANELETEVKAIDETADYAESAVSDQSLGL